MRASRSLLFVLACAATLIVLTAGAAERSRGAVQTQASFPGADGKLAFGRDRGSGRVDVWVANPDGSGQTRLTPLELAGILPAWSPDGSKVVFMGHAGDDEIYTINADGSGVARLTTSPGNDWNPAWSPDGKKITWSSLRNGNRDIWVMNADGSNPTNVSRFPGGNDDGPDWSPDGTKIVFDSDRDGNYEVYVMNADGSGQTNLSNDPGSVDGHLNLDGNPSWSPDGTKIAFTSDRDGNNEVFVMDADGRNQTNLTRDAASDFDPSWSPDGTKIAYMSDRGGNTDVFVMNADGSGQTNVTRSARQEIYGVSWQPLEQQQSLRWRLASDFKTAPNQSNPNPDSYGNPGVWRFMKGTTLHDPSSYSLLGKFISDGRGIEGLESWRGPFFRPNNLPHVSINATGADQSPLGWVWPANTILVHPYEAVPAIVGWHSPLTGSVRITLSVADRDPDCGDGISWYVDKGDATLASGRIVNGGQSQTVSLATNVHVGTTVYFIVADGGAGNFFCDSSGLAINIHT